MLNALSGVVRAIAHSRSTRPDGDTTGQARPATARQMHRRAIGVARVMADALTATPRARERAAYAQSRALDRSPQPRNRSAARRRLYRRHLLLRMASDRTLPMAVALIVIVAAGLSLAPAAAPVGAAQGAPARFQAVRLTVGGGPGGPAAIEDQSGYVPPVEATAPADDGTIYKPVAVDTSIKSSAAMLGHYTVKDGDTLTGIASRFGVSMMTVWWANNFTSKDSLKTGMDLVIPPVTGLVRTIQVGDTLDSIAAENKVAVAEIIAMNNLDDPNLIVGQVLVLPGAKGEPMPTAKPTLKPAPKPATASSSGTGAAPAYTGGAWGWPVIGGGNSISQYFHYGHLGLDIAADYGTSEVAPRGGKVVFAGWKSNGGGYQVWIDTGDGLFAAMYHMSSVTVSTGAGVAKGQRVGRIGSSGWATGNHVHYEVWVGSPWKSGSYRVNPLRYY